MNDELIVMRNAFSLFAFTIHYSPFTNNKWQN